MHVRSKFTGNRSAQPLGFTQIEIVVSTALMGILLVATLSVVAASCQRSAHELGVARGHALADAMLNEILSLHARDPDCQCGFGLETGEQNSNRLSFDDVDDYHNFTESPPCARDGTKYTGFPNWKRMVSIERVQSSDWSVPSGDFQQVYRITVSIVLNNKVICRVVGYRNNDISNSKFFQGV